MIEEKWFDKREAMLATVAEGIAARLSNAIAARGAATLVASGGTSPQPVYRQLAQAVLPWDRVTVTLSDERWVPIGSPDSNEGMIRRMLLEGPAAKVHFVGLKTEDDTPEKAEVGCNAALATLSRPFDVVLLGMGVDGHTASLFPGTRGFQAAIRAAAGVWCKAVHSPDLACRRMTLTLSALLDTREIVLLITGEDKRRVYQVARQPGPVDMLPVRAILHQKRAPVQVFWAP